MTDRQNREIIAIAYLSGVATLDQTTAFNHLYAVDEAFQFQVAELEKWLAPLNESTEDVSPPDDLFDDIMSEIDKDDAAKVIPIARAANDHGSSRFWKLSTLAASLAAIMAIGSHWAIPDNRPIVTASQQEILSVLSAAQEAEIAVILYDAKSNRIIAHLNNVSTPSDKDLELWLIRDGLPVPKSLGIIPGGEGDFSVTLPPDVKFDQASDVLAISLEPLGGSGAKGPQGPVLMTGLVTQPA